MESSQSRFLIAKLLLVALALSGAVYPLIVWAIADRPRSLQEAAQQSMTTTMGIVAGCMLLASYVLPLVLLRPAAAKLRDKLRRELNDQEVFEVGYMPFVIQIAMRETVAVCGFIAGQFAGSAELAAVFSAIAITGMLAQWPTPDRWRSQM